GPLGTRRRAARTEGRHGCGRRGGGNLPVKLLVTGATGMLGSATCARAVARRHEVVAVVRPGARRRPAGVARVVEADLARADRALWGAAPAGAGPAAPRAGGRQAGRTPAPQAAHDPGLPPGVARVVDAALARAARAFWSAALAGVDAVVNCAGVLQAGARQAPEAVHHRGIAALFEACVDAGVRRVVHLSAIGVDRGARSPFSATKLAGDRALAALDLDWVILRPSVVLGPGAAGAGALVRGLAVLPVLPLMPGMGRLQVVQEDEVV